LLSVIEKKDADRVLHVLTTISPFEVMYCGNWKEQ